MLPTTKLASLVALGSALAIVSIGGCDCEVEPLARVPGRVAGILCDATTGLPVSVQPLSISGADGKSTESSTDEGGSFLVDGVAAGPATLSFAGRTIQLDVVSNGTTTVDDPACRGTPAGIGFGDIIGTICNRHTGGLVSDAEVVVPLEGGANMTTRTDANGSFALFDVPTGERIVNVSGDGFQRSWLVEVRSGAVTEIISDEDCRSPNADEGMLAGTFCDPSSSGPLTGALVTVTDADDREHSELIDADGSFLLGPMTPGLARIHIERDAGDIEMDLTAIVEAGAEAFVTNGGGCVVETCEENRVESDGRTELLFVVDRSGSMNSGAPGYTGTRWEGIVGAVAGVTDELQSRIMFGLALYPSTELDECSAAPPYLAPAFDNADQLNGVMQAFDTEPAGATPTAKALREVLTWHNANPTDRKRSLLLATDGAPNCNNALDPATCVCSTGDNSCADGAAAGYDYAYLCLDDAGALDAVTSLFDAGLETYIIGIAGVGDSFGNLLDEMAQAGGTNRHYVARDLQALEDAVIDIARRAGGCTIAVQANLAQTPHIDVVIEGAPIRHDATGEDGFAIVDREHIELYGEACEAYLTAGTAEIGICTVEGAAP